MYELEIIIDGFKDMITKPKGFFKEISRKEILLIIPIIVLVVIGLLMTVISLHQLDGQINKWKASTSDLQYNVNTLIKAYKTKAFLYPVWLVVFWCLFCIAITFTSSALGGWGEFQGYFNCMSFLIYPFALIELLRFFFTLVPSLMIIYYVLVSLFIIWTIYLLVQMAMGAGELDLMHSLFVSLVPSFFFALLWLSYEPIINMVIINYSKT